MKIVIVGGIREIGSELIKKLQDKHRLNIYPQALLNRGYKFKFIIFTSHLKRIISKIDIPNLGKLN